MYTISRIHTLIKPVMHGVFQRYVDACDADKHSKTFKNYDLLVAMLFAVFSNSRSLRVLEQRFNAHPSHHITCTPAPFTAAHLPMRLPARALRPSSHWRRA